MLVLTGLCIEFDVVLMCMDAWYMLLGCPYISVSISVMWIEIYVGVAPCADSAVGADGSMSFT